jgi:hypothetical protein
MSYTISPDGKAITCRRCGLTSHNRNDVANRYCGHCNKFHEAVVYAGSSAAVTEFDCSECGRHIVSICGPRPALDGSDRCAACLSLPGWFNNPEIARMLDPDGIARPRRVLQ